MKNILPWSATLAALTNFEVLYNLFKTAYATVIDWMQSDDLPSRQRAELVTRSAHEQKIAALMLSNKKGLSIVVGLAKAGLLQRTTATRAALIHSTLEQNPVWVTQDQITAAVPTETIADFTVTFASEEFYLRMRAVIASYKLTKAQYGAPSFKVSY